MGQQQLLLLVLGIVIVGIAVVAGIQAFSEGKAKAQQDAAVTDAMRIISDTQAWKLKPKAFGGGDDGSTAFTLVNLKALGYPVASSGSAYITTNGCFTLTGGDAASLAVHALADGETAGSDATACAGDEIATVTINGTESNNITWAYAAGTGGGTGGG
ncbi:MAG: hypothetical protein ACOCTG_05300 [Bacteroidota bacterium]